MEHPVWSIRSTVARMLHTHAFDPMIVSMPPEQLFILFLEAKEQTKKEDERMLEWVKAINQLWEKNFSNLFDELKLFVNPDMFKKLMELRNLKIHREDINEENFASVWDDMLKAIPQSYVEVEQHSQEITIPDVDEETERMLAGWVPRSLSKGRS